MNNNKSKVEKTNKSNNSRIKRFKICSFKKELSHVKRIHIKIKKIVKTKKNKEIPSKPKVKHKLKILKSKHKKLIESK